MSDIALDDNLRRDTRTRAQYVRKVKAKHRWKLLSKVVLKGKFEGSNAEFTVAKELQDVKTILITDPASRGPRYILSCHIIFHQKANCMVKSLLK